MKNGCCEVELPNHIVYGSIESVELAVKTSRRTVFSRYRWELIYNGEVSVNYDTCEDLLEKAQTCANIILANECFNFVAVERIRDGVPRVVPRETFLQHPARYEQMIFR